MGTPANAIKLRLLKNHTDDGRDYQAGDEISVDETTAAWLVAHEIAEPASGKPAAAKTPGPAAS